MTTELEKQFFDTFGIEPRYEDACTVEDKYWNNEELANKYGTFDQYMNCKCGDQENCTTECSCAYQKEIYPQITDHILLELIKILSKEFIFKMFNNFDDDWALMLNTRDKDEQKWFVSCNGFKDALLSLLMNVCNCSDADNLKHQVQRLFEEK